MRPIVALTRSILIEARRSGLLWLALGSVALALALAGFLSQVAITESLQLQAAVSAALLRACAVFIVATYVITSTVREANDKVIELVLSLPVSRAAFYLGKLCGYMLCGAALAACFALPLLIWAPPGVVALWGLSLALESLLVAAASLFFAMALEQVLPSIAATAGLYLLARVISAVQAIAGGPLAEPTMPQRLARGVIDAIALVLPRLDAATRTDWLLYGAPSAAEYGRLLAGLGIYTLLLVAAGVFDFGRRNL
jgi:ABC-type Na+ efflux pump permease subunit